MSDLLAVEGLSAAYGRVRALHDVSLDVPANRITALIGPSGSGKSSLLRCVNGLETFQQGDSRCDPVRRA